MQNIQCSKSTAKRNSTHNTQHIIIFIYFCIIIFETARANGPAIHHGNSRTLQNAFKFQFQYNIQCSFIAFLYNVHGSAVIYVLKNTRNSKASEDGILSRKFKKRVNKHQFHHLLFFHCIFNSILISILFS